MLTECYGSSGNSGGRWEGSRGERKKGIFNKWRLVKSMNV